MLDVKAGERRQDALPIRRIRPAYHQIAEQIRGLILSGTLQPGEQLPSEEQMSTRFGVSRNTTREALRMLTSQGLVRTSRGATGGTFVALPDSSILQAHIETGLGLMSGSNQLTREELFETRVILEIPAARLAAERRTEIDIERLRLAHRHVEAGKAVVERADGSVDFHQAVLDASGNRLLSMIAPPVWKALSHCAIERGGVRHIWHEIDADHAAILHHIEHGNADAAADAMHVHLVRLRDSAP